MSENGVALADQALQHGAGLLRAAADPRTPEEVRVTALNVCEAVTRRLEHIQIELLASLVRDGTSDDRGYRSTTQALADLLGCDTMVARRRVRVAEDVSPSHLAGRATSPAAASDDGGGVRGRADRTTPRRGDRRRDVLSRRPPPADSRREPDGGTFELASVRALLTSEA